MWCITNSFHVNVPLRYTILLEHSEAMLIVHEFNAGFESTKLEKLIKLDARRAVTFENLLDVNY